MALSSAEKTARYRLAHPERVAESQKRSNEKNKEKRAAMMLAWREKNKYHVAQYQKEYEEGRKHTRSEKRREQYAENAEAERKNASEWRKANPEKAKAIRKNGKMKRRGADGAHTANEVSKLLQRQQHKCGNPFCQVDLNKTNKHLDHIVAIDLGGSNSIENLQWLCAPCNQRKSNLPYLVWLRREANRKPLMAEVSG